MSTKPNRKILLINGPNLNLLGTREPGIYGTTTLPQVIETVTKRAQDLNITIVPFQSNHEGAIIDFLHSHFLVPSTTAASSTTTTTTTTTSASASTSVKAVPTKAISEAEKEEAEEEKKAEKVAVIINPAAYTHTSVAIRDALLATSFPFVEVHISNVHARGESFRNHSYFSDKATGVIMGLGTFGYIAALEFWADKWDTTTTTTNPTST
jgi:3-dehydroquinate dehydratase-2